MVFYSYVQEMDHTILECLAYNEDFEILLDYLEIKLPASFGTFQTTRMRYDALYVDIFLSALAKNIKYILKDILDNFKQFKYYHR